MRRARIRFARARRIARRAGIGAALAVTTLVAAAPTASAHVVQPSDSQHYRTTLTGVFPSTQLFSARVGSHGDWVELTATGSQQVTVLGYFGEPYIRVGSGAVDVNVLAPTERMNGGLFGTFGPADLDTGRQPPQWKREQAGQTVRWHDLRTTWVGGARPPDVAADPSSSHLVDDWTIGVEAGGQSFAIKGTLEWVPLRSGRSLALLVFLGIDTVLVVAGALWLRRRWQGWTPRRPGAERAPARTPVPQQAAERVTAPDGS